MRVILVIPQSNYPAPPPCLDMFPQGPAYIAGSLIAAGHDVRGVSTSHDMSGEPGPVVLRRILTQAIIEHEPEVILLGAMAAEYLFLKDTLTITCQVAPGIPTVCGGGIMTNDPTSFELLRPNYAVMDEGEYAIVTLLAKLKMGEPVNEVAGVAYWDNGVPRYNKPGAAIDDLDALPYPDYDVANMQSILDMQNQTDNYFHVRTQTNPRMLPISTGRSCPFKCTFCQYSTVEGSRRSYRGRTMASVIDEITFFHNKYNFNILKIYDDLFSVKEHRIREFCERLKKTGLDIHWNASMRVGDVTPDLLREMKDAGCIHIGYGFESASDDVLKNMQKRITKKDIERAIDITEVAGIGVQGNFIYGDPAETLESIEDTKSFYYRMGHDHIIHSDYITPYPGSPIFDHSLRKGVITDKMSYYESIHLRPVYNMTELPRRDLLESVNPIIKNTLKGLKFAKNEVFSDHGQGGFESPYFENKEILEVTSECPHCNKQNSNVFPRPKIDKNNLTAHTISPIRFFCDSCHKRLLISTLTQSNLKSKFERLKSILDEFVKTKEEIVVTPILDSNDAVFEIYEAYGLPLSELNIHSYMTGNPTIDGAEYRGLPVYPMSSPNIMRHASKFHLVLELNSSDKLAELLLENGVAEDKIISLYPLTQHDSLIASVTV